MVSPLENWACQHNPQKANSARGSHKIMREAQNHTAARNNEKREGQSLEAPGKRTREQSLLLARLKVKKAPSFQRGWNGLQQVL